MYDTDIATISPTGEVTAKKHGIAKGLVTDTKSGYSMEIAIIVEDTYGQVDIGGSAAYILCEDGSVHSWGLNYYGALGIGTIYTNWNDAKTKLNTNYYRVKTTSTTYLENIVKIASGDEGCLAIDKDGNVWGWGINDLGILGLGNRTNQAYAKLIYSGGDAVDITSNRWGSAILLKDGSVYTTGSNRYGQLANSSVPNVVNVNTEYIAKFTLAEGYEKIIKVELSNTSMKGLKVDGTLWTVGIGGESETHADKTITFESSYIHGDGIKRGESDIVNYPVKANLENVVDFTTRGNIVIAKTANKDLYTWGSYMLDYNEETKTTKYKTYTDYTKVASNVDQIAATWSAGFFTREGETGVYSFGTNNYGDLCREMQDVNNPLEVGKVIDADGKIRNDNVIKICDGRSNAFAYIVENGNVLGGGYNEIYFMGKKEIENYHYITPICGNERIRLDRTKIGDSIDLDITIDDLWEGHNIFTPKDSVFTYEIYPEYQNIATITNEGIVTGISEGRARGKIRDVANNLEIELVIEVEKNYVKVEKSSNGTFAIDIDGNVWGWGRSNVGQIGNGRAGTYSKAQRVMINSTTPLTGVVKIAAGAENGMAIDKDGSLYTWGWSIEGGLLIFYLFLWFLF